jgi:hypothetical protein
MARGLPLDPAGHWETEIMSHHHILPPLIYMPPPKPKKIETRKSRVRLQSAGHVDEASETEEASESGAPAATAAPVKKTALPQLAIEGADRKPPRRPGMLSQGTLHVLLGAQEVAR